MLGRNKSKRTVQTHIVQEVRQTAKGQDEKVNLLNQLPFAWSHTPRNEIFLYPTSNSGLLLLVSIVAPSSPFILHLFH